MPDQRMERALAHVYAACEDASQELGPLAAELNDGQLRSLLTSVLGAMSAAQWYALKRLGGHIPGHEGDEPPTSVGGLTSTHSVHFAQAGDGINWPELWAMADHSAALNGARNDAI
jgi:hypothetical protein